VADERILVVDGEPEIVDEIGKDGILHPEPGEGAPRLANPPWSRPAFSQLLAYRW